MNEAEKQIEYIEEMIATTKGNLSSGSIHFLLWGWLVFIAALSNYIILNFTEYNNHWIPWPVLMGMGAVLAIYFGRKESKESVVVTKIDKMLIQLWAGFGITLAVVLFAMGAIGPTKVYPMLMALYGLGTFVSGGMLNFKPLQIGAVAAWVCAAIGFYQVQFDSQLILIAAAILFSYIIPGHLLASKK
ncbi:MAG: hypothetical protein JKY48_19880 [Flavobacteriales bacterium]|nr:hypothetical protein [Flavobacteriales bacterium]